MMQSISRIYSSPYLTWS